MKTVYRLILLLLFIATAGADADARQKPSRKKSGTQQGPKKKKKSGSASRSKKKTTVSAKSKSPKSKTRPAAKTNSKNAFVPAAADREISLVTREGLSDTANTKTVVITSAFKPSLQHAAKINFNAATPVADSSKIPLTYTVPSSNLFFSYQPVPIKPLALPVDSGYTWTNHQRVKAGAGNLNAFMGEARFSFGDGKKAITNLNADYLTMKGNQFAQQYSKLGIDVRSILNPSDELEWTTHAFFTSVSQYRYGFQPSSLVFSKDQLKQIYNTVGLELGVQNKQTNALGLDYHPRINYYRFTDNISGSENNVVLNAPIEKSFTQLLSLRVAFMADWSVTSLPANRIQNNLYTLNPALIFLTPNLKLNLGLKPSWDNSSYEMLPDITAELKLGTLPFSLEAGWEGSYVKNTYRSLTGFNPWIAQPGTLRNTRLNEQYAGLKGNIGNHMHYNARVSYIRFFNQPLFVNDNTDGKSFLILYEPEMSSLRLQGELGYTVQEKLSLLASAQFNQYSGTNVHGAAWGLVPVELTGSALWKPFKDLQVKSDLFFRTGNLYRNTLGNERRTPAGFDLNLGGEFAVTRNLNVWLQMNNLFNNIYQRWNQYPVFGFNVMAGVVYSFQ